VRGVSQSAGKRALATIPSVRETDPVEQPEDVLRTDAIEALRNAQRTLLATEIDQELRSHGWTQPFARALAAECDRVRGELEGGKPITRKSRDFGLGRFMQEEVSPMVSDQLKDVVHEATASLRALSEASNGALPPAT